MTDKRMKLINGSRSNIQKHFDFYTPTQMKVELHQMNKRDAEKTARKIIEMQERIKE